MSTNHSAENVCQHSNDDCNGDENTPLTNKKGTQSMVQYTSIDRFAI